MEINIPNLIQSERAFFKSGKTLEVDFRTGKLKLLSKIFQEQKSNIYQALYKGFKKSGLQSVLTETKYIINEF
tara:strand:+ start:9389 stop:9607 length:219 start_codon:yes stop_codon:yes gene_type:complete